MNPLKRFGGRERQRPHTERNVPEIREGEASYPDGRKYYILAEADASHPGAWLAAENPAEARR